MKQIKFEIIAGNENYKSAINYDGTNFYNYPMTILINEKLFILKSGTNDSNTVKQKKDSVFIVSENSGLNYIGLMVIDLKDNVCFYSYLDSSSLEDKGNLCYNLIKKPLSTQIRILSQYLN